MDKTYKRWLASQFIVRKNLIFFFYVIYFTLYLFFLINNNRLRSSSLSLALFLSFILNRSLSLTLFYTLAFVLSLHMCMCVFVTGLSSSFLIYGDPPRERTSAIKDRLFFSFHHHLIASKEIVSARFRVSGGNSDL